jgi:hypothetical protein
MPFDNSVTGNYINQLMNPPDPNARFNSALQGLDAYKQFQANQAAASAYQQSVDPTTGEFDQGKFNALASQAPGGAWKFGAQMQQAGLGLQAQGAGTQAWVTAQRDQLGLLNGYLTPLLQKANSGAAVSPDEVRSVLNNAIGITPQMKAAAEAKLASLQPGQSVNDLLRGFQFATQSGESQASRLYPTVGQNVDISKWLTEQTQWPDPNDPTKIHYGTNGDRLRELGIDPTKLLGGAVSGGYGPGAGVGGKPSSGGGVEAKPASGSSAGGGGGSDPRGMIPYIRQAAIARNIDPDTAVKVAGTEGLGEFLGDGGQSGGAFQLHVTPGNKQGHVGDLFMQDTRLDPRVPKNEKATIDYALDYAAQNGWGAWNGAKRAGITGFAGIGQKPPQVAAVPPASDNAQPGGYGPGASGTYIPPGGNQPLDIKTGKPVNPAVGPAPIPQPPGAGQPTNINQPTPPVGGPTLVAGGGAQLLPNVQAVDFPTGRVGTMPVTLPETAKASGQQYIADLGTYNQLPARLSPLTQAAGILKANPTLGTGTGAEDIQKLASLAQNFGFTLSPAANNNLTAFTELNKDLERYYLGLPGGQRSDLAQAETKMSQPSTQMQREALEDLVARTIGLERANSAPVVNFMQQHGQGNAANYAPQYQAEAAAYRNTLDPVAFGFDHMTTQQRKAYLDSLTTDDARQRYLFSIKEASRLYGIPLPR